MNSTTMIIFAVLAALACLPVWITIKSMRLAVILSLFIGIGALVLYLYGGGRLNY